MNVYRDLRLVTRSTCPFGRQRRLQLPRGDQSAAPPGTPSPARAAAASPVAPVPTGRGPGAGSQRDSSCNRSAARTAREPRLRRPLATRPNTAPQPDTAHHGAIGEQASPRAESRPCARGARGRTPHSSRRACARPGKRRSQAAAAIGGSRWQSVAVRGNRWHPRTLCRSKPSRSRLRSMRTLAHVCGFFRVTSSCTTRTRCSERSPTALLSACGSRPSMSILSMQSGCCTTASMRTVATGCR